MSAPSYYGGPQLSIPWAAPYSIDDAPYISNDPNICRQLAQDYGAFAWDPISSLCLPIFGKIIPIGPDFASIQEGFELVNFNFRVNGTQMPVPTPAGLPGPVMGKDGNPWNEPKINGTRVETA